MKRLLLIPLALAVCICRSDTWTDGKGMVAKSHLSRVDHAATKLHLTLMGAVAVVSDPQGLAINSDQMEFNATPDSKNAKAYLIQNATAVGHVLMVKTATSAAGKKTTRIEGAKADFQSGVTDSVVKIAGPVKIQSFDESQQPTMVATGNSGVAVLEPLKQTALDNALKKAKMDGNVHLVLTQIEPKTKKQTTIRTESDHMVLETLPSATKVTLTGSVHVATNDGAEMTGAKRAVFFLEKNGNYRFDTSGVK